MRTVTFGAACSLDGFIARPDGGVDWLAWSDDVPLFHRMPRSLDLELVRFEPIAHGCLYVLYRVRR